MKHFVDEGFVSYKFMLISESHNYLKTFDVKTFELFHELLIYGSW